MRVASLLAVGAVLFSLVGALRAALTLPMEFRDGMVWVEVATPKASRTLNFLLDSGAGSSVLDLKAAQQLGVKLGARLTVQGVHSRGTAHLVNGFPGTLGGFAIPRQLLALDLSAVSAVCHRRIDGLLGADFLRNRIVQIDFAHQKLRLLDRGEVKPEGCEVLPLARRGDALCVQAVIAGQPAAWLRVDTGCNTALEWVRKGARGNVPRGNSIGVASVSSRQLSVDLRLGAIHLGDVKAGIHPRQIFPGEAGLLGNGVLAKFTVTFDGPGGRLLLARR